MRYILIALLITTFTNLNAQNAPDFTLTDIDGTEHNLYSYLNEGKTVVLNFSTTDCNECWDFHETQNMNTANALYGADGTDEMVFLFLETKSITGTSELEGNGLYTNGDWITGTNYPIIDGAEGVAAEYDITNTPTVIAVCAADTTTVDLYTAGYPTPLDMYIAHNACTPATAANDLTIIDVTTDVFCETLDPELLLFNAGTAPVDTATFIVSTGTETETVPWNGSIAPNEYMSLALTTPITEATTIEITILNVNDTPDGSSFTQTLTKAESNCVEQLVITIVTDGYGCETLWNITGPVGNLTGGNPNVTAGNRAIEYDATTGACNSVGYDNNTSYTVTYPAPDPNEGDRLIVSGCYEFHIFDDWGDGMCCEYGEGSYTITDQDGNELASGSSFGAEEIVILDLKLAVSGGTIVSSDIELCSDSPQALTTNSPIIDTIRGLTNIVWGTWILDDPLGQSPTPAGGLPNDEFPNDDANFVGYWLDADGQFALGDSIQIVGNTSNITYYVAPFITDNIDIQPDTLCTGLDPAEGYTVSMNPLSCCKDIVSGGTITSLDTIELCIDSTLTLTTADTILDASNGLNNVAWGIWILNDPLNESMIPTGGLPDDQIPTDDLNFAGYWSDTAGQPILGDAIEISADASGITYYIAPLITNNSNEFGTPCTGLDPEQGYTVFMNPLDSCQEFVVDIELPVPTTNIIISPNPAQDYFNISFDLNETNELGVSLYNIIGKRVEYLQNMTYLSGENNIQMNTNGLSSGVYFVVLHTKNGDFSKRITIAKP